MSVQEFSTDSIGSREMPALLTLVNMILVNHGTCTAEHEWTLEMIQQSSLNS